MCNESQTAEVIGRDGVRIEFATSGEPGRVIVQIRSGGQCIGGNFKAASIDLAATLAVEGSLDEDIETGPHTEPA